MEKPQWTLCSLSAHHVGDSGNYLVNLIVVERHQIITGETLLWDMICPEIDCLE